METLFSFIFWIGYGSNSKGLRKKSTIIHISGVRENISRLLSRYLVNSSYFQRICKTVNFLKNTLFLFEWSFQLSYCKIEKICVQIKTGCLYPENKPQNHVVSQDFSRIRESNLNFFVYVNLFWKFCFFFAEKTSYLKESDHSLSQKKVKNKVGALSQIKRFYV